MTAKSTPAPTADAPEAPEVVSVLDPMTAAEQSHRSLIDRMKVHFADQERVEVKVRHDSDVFVQINGYSFLIQPNVKVRVPAQVAELLEQGGYI